MRLLRLEPITQTWVIKDFPGQTVPFYAVLSHTWGPDDDDEVKFEDVQDGTRAFSDSSKPGYLDGLRYFWIDTCCIKKSDSSELARSLNSMFYWYQRAARCYVYLSDVSISDSTPGTTFKWENAFLKSRWFKRGWTLQELIAPNSVVFFSKEGELLGDKNNLATTIAMVSQIPTPALRGLKLSRLSRAERLSWATGRHTTVPEDSAYCLIGIFDVHLHMLYACGEYEKRKKAALDELERAVERSLTTGDSCEDVIRVGGASWSDLSALGQRQLQRLDADLDDYRAWLLTPGLHSDLTVLARTSGARMGALLMKYGVRYEDLSALESVVVGWRESWNRFIDVNVSDQSRVQALLENWWYWAREHENVYMGITAARTLEDLMVWRGRWKK
ncbi:HET-domain-containing protein [Lizonia empirigonia]|nr:HET-domain-containing protein [Lizonia empirigonia]